MRGRIDVQQVWDKVVDQVKMTVIHPSLWKSLEVSVAVAIEGDQFVVGFPAASLHMAGHLNAGEHKNAIEAAIREFTGQTLNLRLIEGETLHDWEMTKAKEARIQMMKDAAAAKALQESSVSKSWDFLLERVAADMPPCLIGSSRSSEAGTFCRCST